MTAPPAGTITFLFTDIEGSTGLWERDSEAMRFALAQHDALMREAIEAYDGYVFKTVGDAFCAVFDRAGDAVEAAVEALRTLEAADWSVLADYAPLRVRMGVHTGEATQQRDDYFGPTVNRVARIEAAGHGGQVLVSASTCQIVRDRLPDGCTLRDWGEHRLKDLRHTEQLFQIEGPGLPDVTAPPATAEALHPRDRVQVVEAPDTEGVGDRGPGLLFAALEAAVSTDGAEVTLAPHEVADLARHKPADLREYRLGRVAEWSQPRYRLDGRFVGLTLLVDQGEDAVQGRWQATEERHDDLGVLLNVVPEPAIVVLGPPGSGKSTLLRGMELDTAIDGLRGGSDSVTFFTQLNQYASLDPSVSPPSPGRWLAERWSARFPALPPLDEMLAEGRVTLLLDALNEMPATNEADFHVRIELWKAWLQALVTEHPGNRVVFSCRSLDYSQPLSTPDLRVPQVRVEPLSDEQVRDFVKLYGPARWREVWAALDGSPQLEVLRSPYFLALLVEQVKATGELPEGRAALFTGFVRQALRREIERGSPLFEPGELLTSRDVRRVSSWMWQGPHDLPERGILLSKLADLAHAMQAGRADGELSQVRIDLDDALDLLDSDVDEAIVAAGEALAVLDEDQASDEIMYVHQLVQEYFAARNLAGALDPALMRVEWRAAETRPSVAEVIDGLAPADALPGLPKTGWEETTLLAVAMAREPAAFVRRVMDVNLELAGRAAALPEVAAHLPDDLLDTLRQRLARRSEDPDADLRDRIACGHAVGVLGDPRFERRSGPDGECLMPPLVQIPAGTYPIGEDEPIDWSFPGATGTSAAHVPLHRVEIGAFEIARFPVTNAEWAFFTAAGGYEDERWWDTEAGRGWRRGELVNEGLKDYERMWRRLMLADPGLYEMRVEQGLIRDDAVERWRAWLAMDDATFEVALAAKRPSERATEPRLWRKTQYNQPLQPVVGVCWFEARAYCAWLSAQTGRPVRLPTEVEWEAAARGAEGRRFTYRGPFDRLAANTFDGGVKTTTPVGVFPNSHSPEGVADLIGNAWEWTVSLFGEGAYDYDLEPDFPYPYDPADGRERFDAAMGVQRVVRGGSFAGHGTGIHAAFRIGDHPGIRAGDLGFRVVVG